MKNKAYYLIMVLLVQPSHTNESFVLGNLKELVIEDISDTSEFAFRYCPDNTCESFSLDKTKISKEELRKVFISFLIFWSDYVYLKSMPCYVDSVNDVEIYTAKQASQIIRNKRVRSFFTRFDENDSNSINMDISPLISRKPKTCQDK